MHLAFKGTKGSGKRRRVVHLSWMSAGESPVFQVLHGCPVVTIEGDTLGTVDGLMVDAFSHRPRFVTLRQTDRNACPLAIPWHSLYFDSVQAHLVFYTYNGERGPLS